MKSWAALKVAEVTTAGNMDEELSSEDRVKIEIERLRRTVGHAVDLDQSSDEDALQVDSSDSDEDGDRDQTASSK